MNVFDFAKKMELEGKDLYERLADANDFPGLKNIFRMLAADEQKHYDTIVKIESRAHVEMADSSALDTAKSIFQELQTHDVLSIRMKKDLEGYRLAMKVEADSVTLYTDAAGKEADKEIIGLLNKIAAEEKQHYNIMENLYDLVLRPEYFLAWREFGNLQDL